MKTSLPRARNAGSVSTAGDRGDSPSTLMLSGLREIASKAWSSGPRNRSMLTESNSHLAPRRCFTLWTKFLGRERILDLPDHDALSDLLECFNGYFIDKIATIRQSLEQSEVQMARPGDTAAATESLTAFQPTSEKEVFKAIRCWATKSCPIDPLPVWMLKQHIGTLLPTITKIDNLSMATGMFPFQFKKLWSHLYSKSLPLMSTYWRFIDRSPNLLYISKVTEKVAAVHLLQHVQENGM